MKSLINSLRRSAAATSSSPSTPAAASDIVSRLPVELHLAVLDELSPDNLITALNVCRSWRYVWLSDSVWPGLADRWFPGLSGHIHASVTGEDNKGEAFRRALHKNQRRNSGRFSSALHHGMWLEDDRFFKLCKNVPVAQGGVHSYQSVRDPEPDQERFSRFVMYNNGRIAWWPEGFGLPFFAIVDDLRTRKRRAYLFPNHKGERRGYKTAMSNQLLLMGNDRILHAWHLELDCLKSVGIPEPLVRCVTEGVTALIVSKNAAVHIWKFGRSLQQIDMSAVPGYDLGPITTASLDELTPNPRRTTTTLKRNDMLVDFIIHPTANDIFFVVTLHDGQLIVHEFNSATLTRSHRMGYHIFSRQAMSIPGHLRWEKIDSYGSYGLFSQSYRYYDEPADDDQDQKDLYACLFACCGVRDVLVTICFNIYTKSFEVLRHHPRQKIPSTFHVWNRRLASQSCFPGSDEWYITSVDHCCDKPGTIGDFVEGNISSIPLYTTSPPRREDISILRRRRRLPPRPGMLNQDPDILGVARPTLRWLWHISDRTETSNIYPVQRNGPIDAMTTAGSQIVVGDDHFLVFLNHHIYTVWSFGDDAKK